MAKYKKIIVTTNSYSVTDMVSGTTPFCDTKVLSGSSWTFASNELPATVYYETTDAASNKTSFLIGTDSDHVQTRTGHTEEERCTALLSKFGKKFTSTGEDITVENSIENQRVLGAKISGQTVKNINSLEWINNTTHAIARLSSTELGKKYTVYNVNNTVYEFAVLQNGAYLTPNKAYTALERFEITSNGTSNIEFYFRRIDKTSLTNEDMKFKSNYIICEGIVSQNTMQPIPFGLSSTQATIYNNNLKYSFYCLTDDKLSEKVITLGDVGGVYDPLEIKEDGSGVYTQNTKEDVLNSSKNWVLGSEKSNTISFGTSLSTAKTGTIAICNLFTHKDITSVDEEGIQLIGNNLYIRILKSKLTTQDVAGFKAWLVSNPVTVRYQLATPIVTTIDKSLVPAILTQATNKFTFGDAVKPSSVEITVPVDKVEEQAQAIDGLQKTVLLLQQQVAALNTK